VRSPRFITLLRASFLNSTIYLLMSSSFYLRLVPLLETSLYTAIASQAAQRPLSARATSLANPTTQRSTAHLDWNRRQPLAIQIHRALHTTLTRVTTLSSTSKALKLPLGSRASFVRKTESMSVHAFRVRSKARRSTYCRYLWRKE